MKFRRLLIPYFIALPLLTAMRFVQQFVMTDPKTGFVAEGYAFASNLIMTVFYCFTAVMLLLSFITKTGNRVCVPATSEPLGAVSFIVAGAALVSTVINLIKGFGGAYIYLLLGVLALGTAACFAWMGVSYIGGTPKPQGMTVFPVLWGTANLIVTFMNYTGQVSINDSVFDVMMLCSTLVFLLSAVKISCGCGERTTVKLCYGAGIPAAVLCLCYPAPRYIALLSGHSSALHGTGTPDPIYIALFFFITAFLLSLNESRAEAPEEAGNDK